MVRFAIIASGIWLGGQIAALPMLIAQVGSETPPAITTALLSALGSSPAPLILAWVVTRGDKEKAELRAELQNEREENRRLNERAIEGGKETAVLLERAAVTLAEVKAAGDATRRGGRY